MFLSYVQMHEEKRSSRASEREHFSDAAADDGGRGRKIFRSHLGISVIKLTPKEKAGRKEGRKEGRKRGTSLTCPLPVAPRPSVVTSLVAHSFIPTFPLARSLARSVT